MRLLDQANSARRRAGCPTLPAPDVEWVPHAPPPTARTEVTRGFERFVADTRETFETFEPHFEMRDLGERVLASGTISVRASGSGVEMEASASGGSSISVTERSPAGRTTARRTPRSKPQRVGVVRAAARTWTPLRGASIAPYGRDTARDGAGERHRSHRRSGARRAHRVLAGVPALVGPVTGGLRRMRPGSPIRRRLLNLQIERGFAAMARSDVDVVVLSYEPDAEVWMKSMSGVGISDCYRGHEGIRTSCRSGRGVRRLVVDHPRRGRRRGRRCDPGRLRRLWTRQWCADHLLRSVSGIELLRL